MAVDTIARRFSRRLLLRSSGLTLAGMAGATLLAACTPPSQMEKPSAPAKPAEAAKPAAAATAAKPAAPAAQPAATAAKPAEAAKPAATTAAAAPAKPAASAVNLKVSYWSSSPEDHNVFQNVFDAFQEKNPGVTVQFDDVPSDEFQQKMLTMIVAGTPPDTMELHPAWVLSFIGANQLNDLTDRAKTDKAAYIPAQLDFWSSKEKLYGMPYYSGPSFIFYNKSMFQKAGVKTPEEFEKEGNWTWNTLQDLAKKVSTGSGAEKTFGWDASQNAVNVQFYTCVPIWDNGGELVNKEETEWTLDTPEVIETMQWHADLILKDKATPLPSDLQGISWMFRTGRLGMAWAGRFRSIELVNAEFEVGMVGTPKGKVGPINRDGPNASGLPMGTKNLDQAYKLATFMGSPDAAPVYLASGRALPVRTDLLDSDAFKKSLKPYERQEVLVNAAKTVRAWRIPGRGAEALRTIQTEWEKVLIGQADVPTAMKSAKAAMDPLLKVR
ncbi:MAG: sugar ABC transporter substrate-binding protein [Chloroflexota bacterium]